MKINPAEISHIEDAGELDGSPVKLVKTKGGFWIATGRPMGRPQEQALAAGSHPAIVKYNLEKMHPSFRPMMMKSATFEEEPLVIEHTENIPDQLKADGHQAFSIQQGNKVEFQVTQQGMKVAGVHGLIKSDRLEISTALLKSHNFFRPLAVAVAEKAMLMNLGFRLV